MNDSPLLRGAHASALFALAVAQPVLDLLGGSPAFFVARGAPPADVVLLVLGLCAGVPALLLALEWGVARISERAAELVHLLLVGAFSSLLALLALGRWLDGSAALAVAGATGAAALLAYSRLAAVRTFLTVLSPAPLVVALLFALRPGMASVLMPGRAAGVANLRAANPAPIVFVLFDEFDLLTLLDENEQIDAKRYPAFGELARRSTWFRNATSMSFHTETAVPSLLTGRLPREGKVVQSFSEYPQNLFTLLGGAYQVVAFESLTRLCPKEVCRAADSPQPPARERLAALIADAAIAYGHLLLPPALAGRLPPIDTRWSGFADDGPTRTAAPTRDDNGWRLPPGAKKREVPAKREAVSIDRKQLFDRFIDSIHPSSTPTLFFLHILVPHTDWRYLPSGRDYSGSASAGMEGVGQNGVWDRDEWPVMQGAQRHLLQVGYADHLLGLLVARLRQLDLYDRSLLVITADHGASTVPGEPRRSLGEKGYPELMLVPFFVKAPQQDAGVISDRNVEIIDVVPTVADAIGAAIPWPVDGHSALDTAAPERPEKRFLASGGWRTFPVELPNREWSLRRLIERFGTGTTRPFGVWGIGPYADLAGQPAPRSAPERQGVTVQIRDQRFANVRLDGVVPAHVTGTARSTDGPGPIDIAVAVNGTIAGITRTTPASRGLASFTIMLADSTMRDGANTVEPFVIERVDGEVRLFRPANEAAAVR